jgi:hypothetical protein
MLPAVNPRFCLCRPYESMNKRLVRLDCWNRTIGSCSKAHTLQPSAVARSTVSGLFKHGSLTVDTLDRDGNAALPVHLLCMMPKLAKFLRCTCLLIELSTSLAEFSWSQQSTSYCFLHR